MNLLYGFKYKKRFEDVMDLIKKDDKKILELCFGDTYIAEYCRQKKIEWTGFDISDKFVATAQKQNFDAHKTDILACDKLPLSDVCIMVGSLYHFHEQAETIFSRMLESANRVIISEPVINLSSGKGILAKISKKLTNAGKGEESFRFDKNSLPALLEKLKKKFNFTYRTVSVKRDMLIEILHERT